MIEIKRSHLIAATAIPRGILAIAAALVVGRGRAPAPPAAVPEAPPTVDRTSEPAARKESSKRRATDGTKALAVVTDGADRIGSTLDALGEGYRYETIDEEALADAKAMGRYKAVFLPSGDPAGEPEGLPKALQDYVGNGGTLYASDLRYDAVAEAFKDLVDPASVAQGVAQEVQAEVVSAELREWLGPRVTLRFGSARWRPAAFRGADVTVLLKGQLKTTAGVAIDAPLAVRIAVGKGSVIFTSFHAGGRPGEVESKLMKYLALKTVTAASETSLAESLEDAGFATGAVWSSATDAGSSASHEYEHAGRGPLRFRLEPARPGAVLRLEVVGPGGRVTREEGASTLAIDIADAAAGRWQVRAATQSAPYGSFPAVAAVGVPVDPDRAAGGANPKLAGRGGNVRFERVSLNKPAAATKQARPLRIAVTPPRFDDMGKLLTALGSGYQFTQIDLEALISQNGLDRFDILFLTCGGWPAAWGTTTSFMAIRPGLGAGEMRPELIQRIRRNLNRLVGRGGTLYASDLRAEFIYYAFPRRIPVDDFDLRRLPAIDETEKRLLKTIVPAANAETVTQTLDRLKLSDGLRARRDELLAILNLSVLAKIYKQAGDSDDISSIRGLIKEYDLPATEADCSTIAEEFERRRTKIRQAIEGRSKTKLSKVRGEYNRLDSLLKAQRERLILHFEGAGGQVINANVVDSGLREAIGPTIRLNFPANAWDAGRFSGDGQVLIRGSYSTTRGERVEAPLLVKFRQGPGTVIFTSFHNEAQNSQQELELLRYVVFSAVTAKEEAAAQETMLAGGFSPVKQGQVNRATTDSITRPFKSDSGDPLRFSLNFGGGGAVLRLKLVAPGGAFFDEEADESMVVEARGAPAGEWLYTVTAVKVPHENFAYSVSIGKGSPGPTRKGR